MLKRFCQGLLRWRYPAALVGLGLLLGLPSLWTGMQADDFIIRAAVMEREVAEGVSANRWEPFTFLDGDPQRTGRLVDHGMLPWWTDPQCRLAFWRPLTAVTHMLDYCVWPKWPWVMHVQSLVWFALLIWATAVLYRRLIGRRHAAWIAALAALLFALDDAHALPAGWLANRNAVLAGLFGVLALIAHDCWRHDGWRAGALGAAVALAAGLLCNEAAAATGAYLLAYALFLDNARWRDRWLSLAPYLAVGVVWYAAHQALGFGVAASGAYVDPAEDPIGFVRQATRYGPVLLLGQWGFPISDLSVACSAWAFRLHWLWAVAFLTLLGGALLPLVIRDRLARFWTLGMLLSVLPACSAFAMDRLLMFVGIGGMGLLGQWLGGLKDEAEWVPRRVWWRRSARVLAGLLVAIHVVVAPLLFCLMVHLPRLMGHEFSALSSSFPNDRQLASQTLVVVNPPSIGAEWYLTLAEDLDPRPLPQRSLYLATSCATASITRTDARTLLLRVHGGYLPPHGQWPDRAGPPVLSPVYAVRLLDRLVRGDRNPLRLGQTIELTAATLEITELTSDGRPAEVRFRFHTPLEDPSLRWLEVTGQGYRPFRPPAVGETVEVGT